MSDAKKPAGAIVWVDLTVPEADNLRDFYAAVAGWQPQAHPMGEYADYQMKLPDGSADVCGICHARGPNANIPPQWLIYIQVPDLESSLTAVRERGGKIIDGPRTMGTAHFAVIQDPAGAVAGLIQPQ